MMNTDKNALFCDLAETYHIYDFESLPLSKVAIFSVGLRDDSRIKMKMAGVNYSLDTVLLAAIADRLSILIWMRTEDGEKGINKPAYILDSLFGKEDEKEVVSFGSPEEFEEARRKIIERNVKRWN